MEEIVDRKHRNQVVRKVRQTARMNILTNEDCLKILDILEHACERASAKASEDMLKEKIERRKKGK